MKPERPKRAEESVSRAPQRTENKHPSQDCWRVCGQCCLVRQRPIIAQTNVKRDAVKRSGTGPQEARIAIRTPEREGPRALKNREHVMIVTIGDARPLDAHLMMARQAPKPLLNT